jgi:hypothetical protein
MVGRLPHLDASILISLAAGIGIAAASGLRAFLPLLAIGIAARAGVLELHSGVAWLAGTPALIALGVATVLEMLADKIPAVDHALDLVATVIRPLGAWVGAYAVLAHWPTPLAALIGLALGGGALGLHLTKAKLRLASSATTLGHANPVLSIAEDATAGTILVASLLAPLLVLLLVILLVWGLLKLKRSREERLR